MLLLHPSVFFLSEYFRFIFFPCDFRLYWPCSAAWVFLPVAVSYYVPGSYSVMTLKKYHLFSLRNSHHHFLRTKSRWRGIKCNCSNIACCLLLIGECGDVAQPFCTYSLSEKSYICCSYGNMTCIFWMRKHSLFIWRLRWFTKQCLKTILIFIRNSCRFHLFSLLISHLHNDRVFVKQREETKNQQR